MKLSHLTIRLKELLTIARIGFSNIRKLVNTVSVFLAY